MLETRRSAVADGDRGNSTIIASSAHEETVFRGSRGPMAASPIACRARHLAMVFWL